MMRIYSLIISSFLFLGSMIFLTTSDTLAQLSTIDNTSPSITQDISKVINSSNLDNPIRQGSRLGIESPDGESMINVINVSEIL